MPEPQSLISQLAARTKKFLANNNLTQKELCRLLKLDRGNFSKFLQGQTGLSAETTLALVRLMNLSQRDLQLKFGAPEKTRARIMNLQERGRPMKLDSSGAWVSGQSGQDPNGTDDVTSVKTARDLDNADDYLEQTIAMLRDQQQILRQADSRIEAYIANAQKAHPNPNGVTSGQRYTPDNATSSKPGPRGDKFSRR